MKKIIVRIMAIGITLCVAALLIIGPARIKAGVRAVCCRFSSIVVNPDWKVEVPEYAWSLRDRDNVRQSSIKIGIEPLDGLGDVIPKDQVVRVRRNKNYIVRTKYSQHYLVPQAKALLDEIGERFDARCEELGFDAKFVVTSLLRTEEDVKKLAKINGNVSKNSLHRYGTTFDISYNAFRCAGIEEARQCDEILAGALTEMRKEGRCWVLREVNQPCYHVTVKPGGE